MYLQQPRHRGRSPRLRRANYGVCLTDGAGRAGALKSPCARSRLASSRLLPCWLYAVAARRRFDRSPRAVSHVTVNRNRPRFFVVLSRRRASGGHLLRSATYHKLPGKGTSNFACRRYTLTTSDYRPVCGFCASLVSRPRSKMTNNNTASSAQPAAGARRAFISSGTILPPPTRQAPKPQPRSHSQPEFVPHGLDPVPVHYQRDHESITLRTSRRWRRSPTQKRKKKLQLLSLLPLDHPTPQKLTMRTASTSPSSRGIASPEHANAPSELCEIA